MLARRTGERLRILADAVTVAVGGGIGLLRGDIGAHHRDRFEFVAPDAAVDQFLFAGGEIEVPALVGFDQRRRIGPGLGAEHHDPAVGAIRIERVEIVEALRRLRVGRLVDIGLAADHQAFEIAAGDTDQGIGVAGLQRRAERRDGGFGGGEVLRRGGIRCQRLEQQQAQSGERQQAAGAAVCNAGHQRLRPPPEKPRLIDPRELAMLVECPEPYPPNELAPAPLL